MRVRMFLMAGLLLGCFSIPVGARDCTPGQGCTNIITETNASCTLAACLSTPLNPDTASATVTVTGTFGATLSFEQSSNYGVTWSSITGITQPSGPAASSTTTTGSWVFNLASRTNFRVRASAYATGRATVTIVISKASSSIYDLATSVVGVLPIANGGTGSASGFRLDQLLASGANKSFANTSYTLAFTSTDTGAVKSPVTFTNTVGSGPTVGNEAVGVFIENNRTSTSTDQAVVTGIESVVRARGAGRELTIRGGHFRTYIDDTLGGTAITSVGLDGSVRASGAVAADPGTAFVGIRSYMAPGFTAPTLSNVTNFHAFWAYNESATQAVTNVLYASDGGGGFTNGVNLSGSTVSGAQMVMSNSVVILTGAVDPSADAGVAAPQGSIYLRTNGGANTTLYVKEGAADTAWAGK